MVPTNETFMCLSSFLVKEDTSINGTTKNNFISNIYSVFLNHPTTLIKVFNILQVINSLNIQIKSNEIFKQIIKNPLSNV